MADEKNELWHTNTIYLVDITVVSGKDLLPMDNISSKKTEKHTSDPYVIISCIDADNEKMGEAFQTDVVDSTLNPTWKNGRKKFELLRRPAAIVLRVMDKDKGFTGDDPMGHYEIKGTELDRLFEANSDGWDRDVQLIMPDLSKKEAKSRALSDKDNAGTIKIRLVCKALNLVDMEADLKELRTSDAYTSSGNVDTDIRQAEDALREKEQQRDDLNAEYRDLRQNGENLARTKQGLDGEVKRLKTQATNKQRERIEVQNEVKDLKNQVNALEAKNNSAVNNALIKRIDDYINSIKVLADGNEQPVASGPLFKDMASAFKAAKDKAQSDEKKSEVVRSFVYEMGQWHDKYSRACTELYRNATKSHLKRNNTFNELYEKANRLLFSLQVMGASLSVFKDEFKATGSKVRDITLDMMDVCPTDGGAQQQQGDQEQSDQAQGVTVWSQVWGEMTFVMDDLKSTLGAAKLNNLPLKRLCDKTTAIVDELFAGNSMRLAHEIAENVTNEVTIRAEREDGAEPEDLNMPVDDLIYAFTTLLDDRKDFLKTFGLSMRAAEAAQAGAESGANDGNGDGNGDQEVESLASGDANANNGPTTNITFQVAVAKIIVVLAQPKVQLSRATQMDGSASDEDKATIERAIKELQEEVVVDPASKKIVDAFTQRVFKKEGFEICDCGPNSFFGSLFGSLCN